MDGKTAGIAFVLGMVAVVACGGATSVPGDAGSDGTSTSSSGGSSGGSSSGSSGSSSGSSSDGGVPTNHRPSDAQCGLAAPPGDCTFDNPGAACHSDADCSDAGPNGRCIAANGPPTCSCTWDTCAGDTDCSAGQTCACHGSPYSDGVGNTCVPGNCRIDSDCGPGGYCSPSAGPSTCGSLSGYYCHTPKDQCLDDTDCSSSTAGNMCIYSPSDGFWTCQQSGACAG